MKTPIKNKTTYFFIITAVLLWMLACGYLLYLRTHPQSGGIHPENLPYRQEVKAASEKYGVSEARIYAVIQVESSFIETAVSSAGAVGLMQMLPSTYEELCTKRGERYSPDDLKIPSINIDYCTGYLYDLYCRTGSWDLAHLSYFAGYGNVRKWLSDSRYSSDGKTLTTIPSENGQTYVDRINTAYDAYYQAFKTEAAPDKEA